jgi:hypothetical protein
VKEREQHVSDDILRFAEWAANLKPVTIHTMLVLLIVADVFNFAMKVYLSYLTAKGLGP